MRKNTSKRILCVPMSWGRGMGPLMDCIAVAHELKKAGHEVAFLGRDRFREIIAKEGFSNYPIISPQAPQKLSHLFDVDFPAFQGLDDEKLVRATLDNEFAALEDFKPDIVFSWLQFTAHISAKTKKIPIASVARWTGHPRFTSPLLGNKGFPVSRCTPLFNKLLKEFSLPPIQDIWELDFVRSDLKIVPGTPELEPKLKGLRNVHYVGYLSSGGLEKEKLSQELIEWIADQKVIFIYLSAKQFQPSEYIPIIQKTFTNSKFKVVVAMGLEDVAPKLPASTQTIRFERLVSIDSILPYTYILISTGTRGISWQAALYGVPHICFPSSDPERDFVASMVEKAGAGIKLRDEEFTPVGLLAAIKQVLSSDIAVKAEMLGKTLKDLGGSKKAAELLINSL